MEIENLTINNPGNRRIPAEDEPQLVGPQALPRDIDFLASLVGTTDIGHWMQVWLCHMLQEARICSVGEHADVCSHFNWANNS